MNSEGMNSGLACCTHVEEGCCCFRRYGRGGHSLCSILNDTSFTDGLCHFRKKHEDVPNLYDEARKKAK